MGVLQGTTPSFTITVDTDDFTVDTITALELLVWAGSVEYTYALEDVTLDTDDNTITVTFSEEETLALSAEKSLRWQMRCMFSNGSIVGTKISNAITIHPLKSDEVMTE